MIDGCIAYIDNKEINIEELIKIVKAPDFPTGGIIYGYGRCKGRRCITGRGRVVVRGKVNIETTKTAGKKLLLLKCLTR